MNKNIKLKNYAGWINKRKNKGTNELILEIKMRIFNTNMKSILLYASEM